MVDEGKISRRAAYIAVLMMGVVSMLGDICYESGRGIAPDYLRFLGASAFMVGAVSGAGELTVSVLRAALACHFGMATFDEAGVDERD